VGALPLPGDYPDPRGIPELRAAIAAHVGRHRGLACTPDEVMVTSGTTHGLALLLDVLPPGPVAVEDPGYRAAVATVGHSGRPVVDVPVDAEGIRVDRLAQRGDLAAVYVTPAHQHPLGMAMSAPRRMALLAQARRLGAVVVEDDYDSEFRYDVAPLPALAPLDPERVIYLGTLSKAVSPALRIGWLVAPEALVAAIAERRLGRHDHPSWPLQQALLALLEDGYVERRLRTARRLYAERAEQVVARLARYGSLVAPTAGMYVTLATPTQVAARAVELASRGGIEVPRLRDYCRTARLDGLVVGFGGIGSGDLARALDLLEAGLQSGRDT
jgi:GntR family transcriptional regulator/MocR family aminotransferase